MELVVVGRDANFAVVQATHRTGVAFVNGGVVNFASVRSDIMYLIPRDDDWGLTVADLSQPKFEYLRALV